MRIIFYSLEELQERCNKTYANAETEKKVEEALDKEIEVYYDEYDRVWTEGGVLLGEVEDY